MISEIIRKLKNYDINATIMEVCGTHTSSIARNGIRQLLPDGVRLVSGPGCPVCVTSPSYIDALVEKAFTKDFTVLSFGDLFKVNGTKYSFSSAKAEGASVELIYSPLDALTFAAKNPSKAFIVAAVGFETTVPIYSILLDTIIQQKIDNIKIMTSLKATIPAVSFICEQEKNIDAFLCPGHVAAVIGSGAFAPLAEKYHKPFVTGDFEAEHVITAIYRLLENLKHGRNVSENFYPGVVTEEGNKKAQASIFKYFELSDKNSIWRGIGNIANSSYTLKKDFSKYEFEIIEKPFTVEKNGCRCGEILLGRINPTDCPLFGKVCTPENAIGACMVSEEGACGIWHANHSPQ